MSTGYLITHAPESPLFTEAVAAIHESLSLGYRTYLYCIHDGILALPHLEDCVRQGAIVYACAFAARQRQMSMTEGPIWSGLGSLAELIAHTDQFYSY